METYCCSNGIDRISSLPVDIPHNILSNLCIFDVIHMTVLSKRWKYICTTIPYFRFDSNFSDSDPDYEEFKEFIDTFLIAHKTINLVRFILSCSNMFETTDILRFIDAATRRNVEQLVLWFSPCEPFELPHCLVTCESLQVLKLNLCGDVQKIPNDHNHLGGFCQLKLLHLCSVELLDGHLTKYVNINFNDYDRNCDEKTGILVHKMIKEVPSISLLKLCKASLKGLYKQACLSPICFIKLKSLKLKLGVDEDCMQVMIRLLKYSPNLEVLKLWCDEMHDPEESIVCLDSHLKSIQLIGFKDEENEIELIRFFLKNARVLENFRIVWAGYALKSEEPVWAGYALKSEDASKKVLNIPRTSSQVLLTFHDAKLK
ncbi:hypothetical protein H5410_030203 [Solanum commersonii]|uniref:F-box domain-containing protein n=1 Tax=Solanum commersonii TaxID=4109 RepID=A0A9J5YEZ4_SOLCO|nr:hypothetical protein H5410_030203 [Solanum commersonii]